MRKERREKLLQSLKEQNAVAVVPTHCEILRNGDSHYPFRPDSDFVYLTGFTEANAVAVFNPFNEEAPYTLFLRPRDPKMETWNGRRIGVDRAKEALDVDRAFSIDDITSELPGCLVGAQTLYFPLGHTSGLDDLILSSIKKAQKQRRKGAQTPGTIADPRDLIGEMRLFKSEGEILLHQKAVDISIEAHKNAMAATQPGLKEYEIEALIAYTFRRNGASGPAYSTIAGGGVNATILHYVENNSTLRPGDLLLIDAGAEFDHYAADITRTFPISGRFTGPQRDLYEIVLASQIAAIDAVCLGKTFIDPHTVAVKILTQGLKDLKILQGDVDDLIENEAYMPYYMHKTGHWLGLDVHDTGDYREGQQVKGRPYRPFEAGMITTVEPGLYLPEDDEKVPEALRGVGIRIEDDILVTTSGPRNLSEACPKTVQEIEALVGTA